MHGRKEKESALRASEFLSSIMGGKNKTMPDILLDIEEIRHGVDCAERVNPKV
jgi:hypothetical protein